MNVGRNVPYYLKKGFRVVGIEANPEVARSAQQRYARAIERGRLTVVVTGVGDSEGELPFYVNERTELSSFRAPAEMTPDWSVVDMPVRRLSSLITEYGEPAFVKIDVEHYDRLVLDDLSQNDMAPGALSVEAHNIDVVCRLICMGYRRFKLVNGRQVGRQIRDLDVARLDGSHTRHRFPEHSAGPMGKDLDGPWIGPEAILIQWINRLALLGRGWYDVHAELNGGPDVP